MVIHCCAPPRASGVSGTSSTTCSTRRSFGSPSCSKRCPTCWSRSTAQPGGSARPSHSSRLHGRGNSDGSRLFPPHCRSSLPAARWEGTAQPKCADANGEPASKRTVGLLHRRHITIDHVIYIGRESNQLEDVEAGTVHASDGAYTEYPDSRRDYWRDTVVPALKQIPLKAWERDTGKSQVVLIDARRGRRRPHAKHRALLITYARRRGVL